ncbi:nuclear transport factor 2 family protein [Hyphomonas jannaschiana]|uniref:nuclear transport factor 2 family protein n=1 Tax=Hyphomonas jannaschiana TaxID=86 RepID=UPI0035C6EC36
MKRFLQIAGLSATLTLATLPALASEQDWSADQQAIADLLSNGPMGIETDFEAWASEYHDDWTVWFAGQAEPRAKAPHMQLVRDYIDGGASVVSYEAEFADITVLGDTALARFNATESLMEADGSPRTVRYAGTDYLVRVEGTWKVRATTVAFLPDDGAEE